MRWLKTFLVSLFIGFYFLSITPIHFYAHSFEVNHKSESKSLEDCSYVNLLQTGQGNFLDSEICTLTAEIPPAIYYDVTDYTVPTLLEDLHFYNFQLRGPPAIA